MRGPCETGNVSTETVTIRKKEGFLELQTSTVGYLLKFQEKKALNMHYALVIHIATQKKKILCAVHCAFAMAIVRYLWCRPH